jgi:hypothetical protein
MLGFVDKGHGQAGAGVLIKAEKKGISIPPLTAALSDARATACLQSRCYTAR